MEELKHFMELSKLQVPTVRKRGDLNKVNPETIKEDNDGSLKITRVDFVPTSSGRERFGQGTAMWPKYSLSSKE